MSRMTFRLKNHKRPGRLFDPLEYTKFRKSNMSRKSNHRKSKYHIAVAANTLFQKEGETYWGLVLWETSRPKFQMGKSFFSTPLTTSL